MEITEKGEEYYEKGLKLCEERQYESAIDWFDKAIETCPTHKEAYNEKGKVLITLSKPRDAIECFIFATMIDQDYLEAWDNLEVANLLLGKYDIALKCLDQIIRIDEKNYNALIRKGRIQMKLGKYESAMASFREALKLSHKENTEILKEDEIKFLRKNENLPVCETQVIVKKICILGEPCVGKTSLIRRYVYDKFGDKYLATIGAKITKKIVTLENIPHNRNTIVTLLIWDIAGDEEFQSVQKLYFTGSTGAMIVCDITRNHTKTKMLDWLDDYFKIAGKTPIIFIGNKIDLEEQAEVTKNDLEKISNNYNDAVYYFTSARNGMNVELAFTTLSKFLVTKE